MKWPQNNELRMYVILPSHKWGKCWLFDARKLERFALTYFDLQVDLTLHVGLVVVAD
jgi:hypothetical protein